jgi:hypothetical protein
MNNYIEIWSRFAESHNIQNYWVNLFDTTTDLTVKTRPIGTKNKRNVLCRSEDMEKLMIHECGKLVDDWKNDTQIYDGLIYVMGIEYGNGIAPLYIGKAEKYGRGLSNLSINVTGIDTDKSKFGRWGDNYQYHIGDLSAVILDQESKYIQPKYQSWAESLFENTPSQSPKLKQPVFFWAKAWNPETDEGPWSEFGSTRLAFVEYLLIGLCSSAFPELLLNREGQNRK